MWRSCGRGSLGWLPVQLLASGVGERGGSRGGRLVSANASSCGETSRGSVAAVLASLSSESSGFFYRAGHRETRLPLLHGCYWYPLLFLLVLCCLYMSLLWHFLGGVKPKWDFHQEPQGWGSCRSPSSSFPDEGTLSRWEVLSLH